MPEQTWPMSLILASMQRTTPVFGWNHLEHETITLTDWPEPVGEGHHDVQRSQEEDEMKEEVAVGHSLRLVVNNLLTAFILIVHHKLFIGCEKVKVSEFISKNFS